MPFAPTAAMLAAEQRRAIRAVRHLQAATDAQRAIARAALRRTCHARGLEPAAARAAYLAWKAGLPHNAAAAHGWMRAITLAWIGCYLRPAE